MEPTVSVVGLGKTFPGVRALHEVSITFEPGTTHALVGENGAGKSSLIRCLAGAQRPDEGAISIDGREVRFHSPLDSTKHGLAFIHQEPNLVDDLTVAENVLLGSRDALRLRYLVDRKAMRRRYAELVEPLGLDVRPHTMVSELGVADQTLVAVARALHRKAHFLVFDEPTAALSDRESESLFDIIGELSKAGKTIVYVSHRLHEVFRLSDTVSVLRDGELVTTLPTADLPDRQALVGLILGRAGQSAGATERAEVDIVEGGEPLLEATSVSDGGRVKDVSLRLMPGRITGLAGLVGAGRSELAAVLCGAARATAGEVRLFGKRVAFRSPRAAIKAGVALVPEDRRHLGMLRELDVRENLTMPFLSRFNVAPAVPVINGVRERRWAAGAVDRLSIKISGLNQPIALLSGGNQQKVIVSRWVGAGAKVFVFDEPTQGVDVGARAEIYAVMRELAADGAAVLMISSDVEEVVAQSDEVLVMREGRLVAHLEDATEAAVLDAFYAPDEKPPPAA
ncbi:sugar ABC transporter ATP-binding protein [Nocardioides acrostichi]|uniref:Sugar ABC transporter ATP-binding protein n=1 Tax=Nocardioides acrostichi TaxID=2784339 RepID=A0A930UYJ2_9ACTN|nr:sugar ABC transporter ATP-binding protein [Nocardioides acrostichi]MBF4160754.1 sugar ABC transporter ATP-binding protein [Nocardioides acrostichi]